MKQFLFIGLTALITFMAYVYGYAWLASNSVFIRNPENGSVLFVVDNSTRLSFDNVVNTPVAALRKIEP